jgi:hypothetical protein
MDIEEIIRKVSLQNVNNPAQLESALRSVLGNLSEREPIVGSAQEIFGGKVEKLTISPGDHLVFTTPGPLDMATADRIREKLETKFPGVPVVVIDNAAELHAQAASSLPQAIAELMKVLGWQTGSYGVPAPEAGSLRFIITGVKKFESADVSVIVHKAT